MGFKFSISKIRARRRGKASEEEEDAIDPDDIDLGGDLDLNSNTDLGVETAFGQAEAGGDPPVNQLNEMMEGSRDEELFGEETSPGAVALEDGAASEASEEEDDVDTDLFASIFQQEVEEELSSIDTLIASVADVSPEELLEEAEELIAVVRAWGSGDL